MSRKEEILDALIDILNNQGINSNFTMKELAQKVNIGKSTIYEYFETKEELLHQAVSRIVENGVNEVFKEQIDSKSNFETSFKKEMRNLYSIALNSAHVINIVTPGIQNRVPGEFKEDIVCNVKIARDEYEKRFNLIFMKALKENIITMETIEKKSFLVASLIVGSIFRIANLKTDINTINIDNYVDELYDTVLKIAK